MTDNFASFCDDFYLDMYVNTELELPTDRDTILAFFERIQKQFPTMGCFYRREGEYCLQEDKNTGRYRWVTLEADRIASGIINPSSFQEAYDQDKLVLELMPYMLSVSHLDIDSLDVTFAMDFDCQGSHDEVIAEAFLANTAFSCFLDLPSAKPINCSPSVVIALSDDYRTQARCSIESKTRIFDPGDSDKEQDSDEAISLTFTVRQYPILSEKFDSLKSFDIQCRLAEELMVAKVIPNFVKPLADIISQKRLR
jgi:hypothetical protein